MADQFVRQLGYLGIILVLVLGGLGLPVPEEAPIVLAAVLSRRGTMWTPLALGSCLAGVLLGDFVVYLLGAIYGERVLSLPLTRRFLTRQREAQIKGYFHRHGIKILILGRFTVGFRTAAYLTAGILRLPVLRLFLADLGAATFSTLLMFALGYYGKDLIALALQRARPYLIAAAIAVAGFVAYRLYDLYRARKQAGRPVGPPVPISDEVPLPPDDLHPEGPEPASPPPTPAVAPVVDSEPPPPLVVEPEPAEPPLAPGSTP